MSAIVWTDAHRREALRRCYELAAELAAADRSTLLADTLARAALGACRDLGRFSALLLSVGFDSARAVRELRRVDGLATGRLVRETWWSIRYDMCGRSASQFAMRTEAQAEIARQRRAGWESHGRLVRVKRIRRPR